MATPANRVPVRIARGSKANLDTAIAAGDLNEGEICYATDENGIYVVEGGVLTQATADLTSSSIDALSDVDTTTSAPTDGQVLIWNNVDGEWQPGDVALDDLSDVTFATGSLEPTALDQIVFSSADVPGTETWKVFANSSLGLGMAAYDTNIDGSYVYAHTSKGIELRAELGVVNLTGDSSVTTNTPEIRLNTGQPTAAVPTGNYFGLKLPAGYSTDQTYVVPAADGTSGQALVTNGSGGLSWAAPAADLSATSIDALSDVDTTTVAPTDGQALVWDNVNSVWEPGTVASGSVTSINDIGDVDTATVPPTDGQALVWDNANSQWEPGTVSGGGVTSVNTLTGAVSLGVEDLDDFELQPGTFPYWAIKEGTGTPAAGEWYANGTNLMRANPVDSNGTDWSTEMTALGTTGTFWHSTDAINWTQTTNTGGFDNLPTWFQFNLSPFNVSTHTGGLYISFSDPATAPGTPLADGDVLQYVSADSKFKPVGASGVRALLGIEEYADDTAAGTGGLASGEMYYNTTSSSYVLKT